MPSPEPGAGCTVQDVQCTGLVTRRRESLCAAGAVAAWLGGVHCTLYSTVQYSCTVRGGAGSQSACAAPAARSDDSDRRVICDQPRVHHLPHHSDHHGCVSAYRVTLDQPHNECYHPRPAPPVQCSAAASTRICQRRCQLLSCPVHWPPHQCSAVVPTPVQCRVPGASVSPVPD